jgi:ribonuclease-3
MTLNHPQRQRELEKLIQKLGLSPQNPIDWQLLDLALIHPSFSSEMNYDRLEFVGDAVLRMAAAEYLNERYPDSKVGELASIRSLLVSDRMLAKIADNYGLERYLLLSPGAAGDRNGRQSRLADALEATLGALYLSTHSLDLVRPWLDEHFKELAEQIRCDPALQNYKDALQELTQSRYQMLPEYRVRETSTVHADPERFQAEVWFQGTRRGYGQGRTKKAAEQAAARMAFVAMQQAQALPS